MRRSSLVIAVIAVSSLGLSFFALSRHASLITNRFSGTSVARTEAVQRVKDGVAVLRVAEDSHALIASTLEQMQQLRQESDTQDFALIVNDLSAVLTETIGNLPGVVIDFRDTVEQALFDVADALDVILVEEEPDDDDLFEAVLHAEQIFGDLVQDGRSLVQEWMRRRDALLKR